MNYKITDESIEAAKRSYNYLLETRHTPSHAFAKVLDALCVPVEEEPLYPCDQCGKLRTKAEGGTTFTICDECWDNHFRQPKPKPKPFGPGSRLKMPNGDEVVVFQDEGMDYRALNLHTNRLFGKPTHNPKIKTDYWWNNTDDLRQALEEDGAEVVE